MQGKTINGFTLQRLLGKGGMAAVWYAENEIKKPAAVKILNEDLAHNANIVERFRNEAEIMVKLNHPNIRQVYGYGNIDGCPAIVMEYLDGTDLKAKLKLGQRFTEEQLVKWWNQMAAALNYTHGKGIVHRDIKPGNLFVDEQGDIKLLDFGIAKVRESISSTQTGQKLGTLMYMSPEQVKDSKHIDYRTDLYSLAVTFVHLISGRRPYDSDTSSDFEISEQIVYKPLDMSGLSSEWRSFLEPYLNKDPQQRPALRPFEALASTSSNDDDEDTMVEGETTPKPQPTSKPKESKPAKAPEPSKMPKPEVVSGPTKDSKSETGPKPASEPKDKSKSKAGLWVGLVLGLAALVALVVILGTRSPEVSVSGSADGHDYVDLGLPSGTLWATCNMGASKPEKYGDYYAWGETRTKSTYNWSTYQYANGDYDKLTKYCNKSSYGNKGFTDNLTALQSSDDPATSWGSGWRTPNKEQWDELLKHTTHQWTTQNGVKGRLFTAKNGQTLFLPAAGSRWDSELDHAGSDGNYWSRSLRTDTPSSAWYLRFRSGNCRMDYHLRNGGFSVRPVRQN